MAVHRNLAFSSVLLLAFSVTGCLSPLRKQSAALAAATTPVVEQASAAYHAANALYDTTVDFEAYRDFDRQTPVYKPKLIGVLLPEKDIQVRLKVLEAFQLYVKNLVAITSGTDSPALDAASKSVGNSLTNLSNDVAPAIETSFGIATTVASTSSASVAETTTTAAGTSSSVTQVDTTTIADVAPPVTPAIRGGIAVAANVLGQFLVQRKIKQQLPGIIAKMDPQLKTLCELLESDITILQGRERRDYDTLIDLQTLFIRQASMPTSDKIQLSPEDKRNEIMKLPEIVRHQRTADAQLNALKASIVNLYLTHHALAAVAQNNSPTSLKDKLGELEAAGSNLGTLYSSLQK